MLAVFVVILLVVYIRASHFDNLRFEPNTFRAGTAFYTVSCGHDTNVRNSIDNVVHRHLPFYLITDNNSTALNARNRGWRIIMMPGSPGDDDDSNFKCKLPRSLPSLYGDLDSFKYLVYGDSKRLSHITKDMIIRQLSRLRNSSLSILMNPHHTYPGSHSVDDELGMAMGQARYAAHHSEYVAYIESRKNANLSGSFVPCGCYSLRNMDHPMTNVIGARWYAEILKSGIEDQISLSFVYERYQQFISIADEQWWPQK